MTLETIILVVLLHLGMATHFGRRVLASMTHGAKKRPCITDYWKQYPIQSVLALVGAYTGFLVLYGTPEMTRVVAFGLGYMADNIADAIGDRAIAKMRGGT